MVPFVRIGPGAWKAVGGRASALLERLDGRAGFPQRDLGHLADDGVPDRDLPDLDGKHVPLVVLESDGARVAIR
jgi:hypothetical protein